MFEQDLEILRTLAGPLPQNVHIALADSVDAYGALGRGASSFGIPARAAAAYAETAQHPGGIARVSPGAARHLRRAAVSTPGMIQMARWAYQAGTAGGEALLWHELVHQKQMALDRAFLAYYGILEDRTQALELPPWRNPLEWPAYVEEAVVYRRALAIGLPAGPHLPLLISDGMTL